MKVAIIGSRSASVDNLGVFLPDDVTEIVSGGARGIDACAREYAVSNNIKLTEFLPDYKRYKKGAPLERNSQIINYADLVIAFWDGESRGTRSVIRQCFKEKKPINVYMMRWSDWENSTMELYLKEEERKQMEMGVIKKMIEIGLSDEEIREVLMETVTAVALEINESIEDEECSQAD